MPGIISPVEYTHKLPGYTDFLDRLSKHFRIVVFYKRGNGLSQKLEESAPTLEQRMDDIRFVMDAVDSKRATTNGGLWKRCSIRTIRGHISGSGNELNPIWSVCSYTGTWEARPLSRFTKKILEAIYD